MPDDLVRKDKGNGNQGTHPINFEIAHNIRCHLQNTQKVRQGYFGKYFIDVDAKLKQIKQAQL